jgi:hypothetical protein
MCTHTIIAIRVWESEKQFEHLKTLNKHTFIIVIVLAI